MSVFSQKQLEKLNKKISETKNKSKIAILERRKMKWVQTA